MTQMTRGWLSWSYGYLPLSVRASAISTNAPRDDQPHTKDTSQHMRRAQDVLDHIDQQAARADRDSGPARDLTVPVSNHNHLQIRGRFPLDDKEWQQMMTVLTAMKPGLCAGQAARATGRVTLG